MYKQIKREGGAQTFALDFILQVILKSFLPERNQVTQEALINANIFQSETKILTTSNVNN